MGGLGAHPPFPLGLRRHASNAIVVSPGFSTTGHPILLGGPQTGLDAPSFFWEVGFHDGSYEAEGVIAPAGPGVLIGRGRHFGMTLTSGIDDAVDTYVELLDPADPGRYRFRGRWRPFQRRSETFVVSGGSSVTLEVLRSVHGPVFFVDRDAGVAFSRRAAFRGHELESAAAVLNLGRVRNLADFRRLADRMAMSFNFHYADDAGNIAYFHRGALPRRPPATDPRLPLDGRGTMEWRGDRPAAQAAGGGESAARVHRELEQQAGAGVVGRRAARAVGRGGSRAGSQRRARGRARAPSDALRRRREGSHAARRPLRRVRRPHRAVSRGRGGDGGERARGCPAARGGRTGAFLGRRGRVAGGRPGWTRGRARPRRGDLHGLPRRRAVRDLRRRARRCRAHDVLPRRAGRRPGGRSRLLRHGRRALPARPPLRRRGRGRAGPRPARCRCRATTSWTCAPGRRTREPRCSPARCAARWTASRRASAPPTSRRWQLPALRETYRDLGSDLRGVRPDRDGTREPWIVQSGRRPRRAGAW